MRDARFPKIMRKAKNKKLEARDIVKLAWPEEKGEPDYYRFISKLSLKPPWFAVRWRSRAELESILHEYKVSENIIQTLLTANTFKISDATLFVSDEEINETINPDLGQSLLGPSDLVIPHHIRSKKEMNEKEIICTSLQFELEHSIKINPLFLLSTKDIPSQDISKEDFTRYLQLEHKVFAQDGDLKDIYEALYNLSIAWNEKSSDIEELSKLLDGFLNISIVGSPQPFSTSFPHWKTLHSFQEAMPKLIEAASQVERILESSRTYYFPKAIVGPPRDYSKRKAASWFAEIFDKYSVWWRKEYSEKEYRYYRKNFMTAAFALHGMGNESNRYDYLEKGVPLPLDVIYNLKK